MRIFQEESCITIDFQNRSLKLYSKGEKEMFPGIPEIESEESIFENNDALKVEIIAFLNSIEQGKATQVSGEDGRRALATAQEISRLMQDAKD